jgi:hypothetical protein
MSTDSETTKPPENEDVAQGVTNEPRGTGDLDKDALDAGKERLEQAAGGH